MNLILEEKQFHIGFLTFPLLLVTIAETWRNRVKIKHSDWFSSNTWGITILHWIFDVSVIIGNRVVNRDWNKDYTSLELCGIILELLQLLGNFCNYLEIFGITWKYLELLGTFWNYLENISNYLEIFGIILSFFFLAPRKKPIYSNYIIPIY